MPAIMTRPVLLSPQKIADALDVTRRTVYNWIDGGKLKATKVATNVRISEDDLAELIGEEKARQVFDSYAE